ncbi:hypothetical protein CFBP1159_17760 [Xanthomonas arboricola pv. corylina]|uniref:Uncharacterized protein n=1 Tax=Xanthomonas arboricola pv. corylina TaxID=487821 RepID=A0A8D6UYK3_9XANT|nr:hypothetical protein CFBP1159_17760 [Xanthomonas arboricola pv. corylina]CAE6755058.1 hypothetical protein CFBP1159_17760 [Xanthomonas arboricola pv. corylina]
MSSRIGPAAAFNDDQVMGVLLARPAPPAGAGMALLSPFQAFRSLWWQHWEPRPKDQRPQHWLALLGSLLIHLGFIALLIWVVTVRWAPDDTKTGDESRVRMTFIGDGAAEQGGGQGQPTDAAQAALGDTASAPQSSASAATGRPNAASAASTVPVPAPAESVDPPSSAAQAQDIAPEQVAAAASEPVAPEVPRVTVQVPPVTIESPLQVTETSVATNDFVVPPPPTITVAPRRGSAGIRAKNSQKWDNLLLVKNFFTDSCRPPAVKPAASVYDPPCDRPVSHSRRKKRVGRDSCKKRPKVS